jgi:hypothetical protein
MKLKITSRRGVPRARSCLRRGVEAEEDPEESGRHSVGGRRGGADSFSMAVLNADDSEGALARDHSRR